MNFLALFVGLGLERLVTHLLHLREFHWLDPLFDRLLSNRRVSQPNLAIAAVVGVVTLLVAPVVLAEIVLNDRLAYIPQFIFSVLVLLFCLGPRDLGEELSDFCTALETRNADAARAVARELLEVSPAPDDAEPDIETAVYAQANNRVFGVVFWFVVLGPGGAWLFRVLDLLRHHAAQFVSQQQEAGGDVELPRVAQAAFLLHFLIAWIPGRLLAAGYMLAGSFDSAAAAWKELRTEPSALFPGPTDQLLGVVGKGAAASVGADNSMLGRIRTARTLIFRTLWMIWCPVLAVLTLYDLVA